MWVDVRGGRGAPAPVLMLGRPELPNSPLMLCPKPRPPDVTTGAEPLLARCMSATSLKARLAESCLDISSASPSKPPPSRFEPLTRLARPGAPLCTVTPLMLPLPALAMGDPAGPCEGDGDTASRVA